MGADASDQSLLASVRAGDPVALDALLERYQPRIYRFGLQLCGHPQDAEDVAQETLLAAARGAKDFRGASSLSTWLYTIARSYCIKKRRKKTPAEPQQHPNEALPDPSKNPEEATAAAELGHAVTRAIHALEPTYREVLVLRDVEGLRAAEVAEVLGVSIAAVKSRLHRARLAVREALLPLLDAPATPAPSSDCPQVLQLLSEHMEGDIDAAACAAMQQHVDRCPRCNAACNSLREALALCQRSAMGARVPEPVRAATRRALRELVGSGT